MCVHALVSMLVADSFRSRSVPHLDELAKYVMERGEGNPFAVDTCIRELYTVRVMRARTCLYGCQICARARSRRIIECDTK
jgi:hypothetical protein